MSDIFAFWSLVFPVLVGAGLIVALFYVQGSARVVVRIALVGVLILSAQTLLQGTWTQRWRVRLASEEEKALAERLKNLPTSLPGWDSEEAPIDERGLTGSRTVGFYGRAFRNRDNPEEFVSVYVFCGHPMDMTQHTPDQCYPLNGNSTADDQTQYVVDTGKGGIAADFYTNRFHKSTAWEGSQQVRVFWSFSTDGQWVAQHKSALVNGAAMYKIYAITDVHGDVRSRPEDSAAVGFLREFLPVLNATLFPREESAPKPAPEKALTAAGTAG